jgi:hypothetical protein
MLDFCTTTFIYLEIISYQSNNCFKYKAVKRVAHFHVTQGLNVSELLRADLAFTGKNVSSLFVHTYLPPYGAPLRDDSVFTRQFII